MPLNTQTYEHRFLTPSELKDLRAVCTDSHRPSSAREYGLFAKAASFHWGDSETVEASLWGRQIESIEPAYTECVLLMRNQRDKQDQAPWLAAAVFASADHDVPLTQLDLLIREGRMQRERDAEHLARKDAIGLGFVAALVVFMLATFAALYLRTHALNSWWNPWWTFTVLFVACAILGLLVRSLTSPWAHRCAIEDLS